VEGFADVCKKGCLLIGNNVNTTKVRNRRANALKWLGPLLVLSPFGHAYANTSEGFRAIVSVQVAPAVLDAKEKAEFAGIYEAIRNKKWDEAARLIDTAPQGPMAAMARAELYLAPNSPIVEVAQLEALLQAAFRDQFSQLDAVMRGKHSKLGVGLHLLEQPDHDRVGLAGPGR
jgi:hypothetical protein